MHPAYSVIFFTTASGGGYGLLALAGALAALGRLPADHLTGLLLLGPALLLVSAGLLSSTAHLGRPERAWRAFSQWRTSWLSREGVLAVATFVPASLFGFGWVFLARLDGWVSAMAVLSATGAAATVSATAMVYASLKPVPRWNNSLTLPSYLIFAGMTGACLMNAILQLLGHGTFYHAAAAALASAAGGAWKLFVWRRNDALGHSSTVNAATGLAGGTVMSMEWPHTEENYLLKEMGFRVARKHAARLRLFAMTAGFALPAILLGLAAATAGWTAVILSLVAVLVQLLGVLVERWLFFAEATHTVMLYYGR